MPSDNLDAISYRDFMERGSSHITLTIDLVDPIEALDFAQTFSSLATQFDDYLKESHPDLVGEAKIYVTEVRRGSVVIDMIPWIRDAIGYMDDITIVAAFSSLLSRRVRAYIHGNFIQPFTKGGLTSVANLVKAIAKDNNGSATLESVTYEQGVFKKKLEMKFTTPEARKALETVESHRRVLELTANTDYERVTMTFVRSSVTDSAIGKRSGELVQIENVGPNGLPLIYASDLAEQQIKHVIRESDDNIFKKAFVVDVNVEHKNGRPIAYRLKNLHQVIDLPEDN